MGFVQIGTVRPVLYCRA